MEEEPTYEDSDPDAELKRDIWRLSRRCCQDTIVSSEKCLAKVLTHWQERLEELRTRSRMEWREEPSTWECLERLLTEEKQKYTKMLSMQERRPSMQEVLKDLIRTKYRHGVGFDDQ